VENRTGNDYADQGIPHEAGHIVVGWKTGFPIKEMAIEIVRDRGFTQLGNFITRSVEPSDEQILETPPEILARYKLFLAGGLAGNKFSGVDASNESLEDDRKKLARVGPESLEALAEQAIKIIGAHPEIFQTLYAKIANRFLKIVNDPYGNSGRHTLLSEQQLADVFARGETHGTNYAD
jgi:hypothetical protein